MNEIAIRVENVSKCYQIYENPHDRLKQFVIPPLQKIVKQEPKQYFQEFWALKDISFEVKKGEAVGIVGRNGSGKSTLLQIITGTLSATTGVVATTGRIAALLELGSGFNPDFTGRENVYLNGALLGLTQQEISEKFDNIAAFADIGKHLEQPIKTYSSGMLVRLAFAVQVQIKPDILIIDEALAVGDSLFQKRCFQIIEKLVSNGTTLLFVSHDQESVRTLTNRALLLKQGKSLAWGQSSEVILEYRRQLHNDEAAYFTKIVKDIYTKRNNNLNEENTEHNKTHNVIHDQKKNKLSRSEKLTFGDGDIKIKQVEILNENNEPCSFFYSKEKLNIKITCQALSKIKNINVAIRIRNKEGIKIYSWGTLNQDMEYIYKKQQEPLFWNNEFSDGDIFFVNFSCDCHMGVNLYEVQASVSYEETPDYMSQRILHWVDEAAFFQVSMKRDEYFFGGLTDLEMRAQW